MRILIQIFLIILLSVISSKGIKAQTSPPPTPTLLSPPHNIQNLAPNVKFIWNSSTNAEFYRLQIWQREWWGTLFIFDDSTLTDTTFQIDTLKFIKEYEWCVGARNDSGSSPFSPKWRFMTHINDAPKIVIPLKACNNQNLTRIIHFGVAVGATYCIDEELGEFEIPVSPPMNVFDIRFIDNRIRSGTCLREGIILNLQGWEKTINRDTFRVSIRPGENGLPITFSWPQNLIEFYDELIFRVLGSTSVINMLTDSSLIIDDENINSVRIIGIPKPYRVSDPPVLLSPINGSAIYGSLNLEWRQTLRAYKYWLQVSTDSNFATIIIDDSTNKTTSRTISTFLQPFIWYYWRVGAINSEGFSGFSDTWSFIFSPCSADEAQIIKKYSISQNYPNPFNPSTKIEYWIPTNQFVSLKIYDILGIEVLTLVNENKPAGKYEINFKASGFPSGVYFYRLKVANFVTTKKMILVR